METQYISLNMTPTGVNPCFHISQYDVGRMLGFIVHSGGATVDLDTYTCTVEATRSDGTAITSAVATTDNIGTFEVTPTMSNKTDKYRCQLVIVDANSKRIASLPFDMEVTKAAMDENSEAIEEDASLYQQYTKAVQGAIAEANADIQAEENARIAAVNAEATTRANADATLQNNIDAEATARQSADNTLQGNINSEASTRASADSNLQSQINQIVAPSGEAPSAAEVQNARIGADGKTYGTLGDAIRTNDNALKNALNSFEFTLETGTWVQGSINKQGQDESWNKSAKTDYIEVEKTLYTVYVDSGYGCIFCLYDVNKVYLGRSSFITNGQSISLECAYVRLIFGKTDYSEIINQNTVKNKLTVKYKIKKYNDLVNITNQNDKDIDNLMVSKIPIDIVSWTQGAINNSGQEEIFNQAARTDYIKSEKSLYRFSIDDGYMCTVHFYDSNKVYKGRSAYVYNTDTVLVAYDYIRLVFSKDDFSEIINQNIVNSKISITCEPSGYSRHTESLNNLISASIITQMLSGISISSDEHKLFIPDMAITDTNGNVYLTSYIQDESAYEGNNPYLGMTIFNIINPSKYTLKEVFKAGMHIPITGGGYDVISSASDGILMFVDSDTIRIVAPIRHYTNTFYMCYRDYTISTDTLGDIQYCDFDINGTSYPLDSETGKNIIIPALSLTNVDTDISHFYIPQCVSIGGVHYAFIALGYGSNVLCKSNDGITWEFESEATTPHPYGEFAMQAWGSKIVAINRSGGNSGESYKLYVCVYDTTNSTWEYLNITKNTNGGNKPALAIQNDKAYFMEWVDGNSIVNGVILPRTFKAMYMVDLDNMRLLNKIPLSFDIPLCDSYFAEIGTAIYTIVSTDKRGFLLNGASDGRSEASIAYFNPMLMEYY